MKRWAQKQTGFTIVELLIVVVVIAILAAIIIVAYNGVSNNAKKSAVENTLAQISKKVESYRITDGGGTGYPATLAAIQYTPNPDITVEYHYNSVANSFCVDAVYGDLKYSVRMKQLTPVEGACIDNGLELWLPLNGNANDASGGNTTFTVSGSPTATTGANGAANGAMAFDGDDYGQASNPTGLPQDLTQFSVSLWVRSNYTSDYQYFVHRGVNTSIGNSVLFMGTNAVGNLTGAANGEFGGGATGVITNDNQWHHLVMSYGGGRQIGYVDGTQRYNSNIGPITNNATSNTFFVGAGPAGYRPFRGALDDIRIYRRALTAAEITQLFNQGAQ